RRADFGAATDTLGFSGSIGVRAHETAKAKDESRRTEGNSRSAAEEVGSVQSSSRTAGTETGKQAEAETQCRGQGQYRSGFEKTLGGKEGSHEEVERSHTRTNFPTRWRRRKPIR